MNNFPFLEKLTPGVNPVSSSTQTLAKQLMAKNVPADAIHGDLLQKERDKVMRAFRNKSLRILVSTDIAARGIDVDGLAYVVHYQMPDKDEYFTHRSGRTARAGKEGVSLSIVNSKESWSSRNNFVCTISTGTICCGVPTATTSPVDSILATELSIPECVAACLTR